MGFFSLKATCAICGKEVGLNRFKIMGSEVPKGMELWKCPSCTQKGGILKIHPDGKVDLISAKEINKATEVRMKCNVCGHVYCYTLADLERNRQNARQATMSGMAGVAGALSGHYAASGINTQSANSHLNQIVDYEQCPHCQSRDVVSISDEEFKNLKEKATAKQPVISQADELRKYKELLDIGAITQEEFEAKKKHLLEL